MLFARMALAALPESAREEVLDCAVLVQRAQAALEACEKQQLLHVVALADIADEGLRRDVEKLAEAVLFRGPLLMLLLLSVALTLQWRPQLASTGGEEGGQPMVPVAKSVMAKAEKTQSEFLEAAQQLKGSQEWHMEPEAQRLRAQLDQQVDTAAALAEERARAALVQRSTIEVIGRLQDEPMGFSSTR
eukprot:g2010.t1